MKTTLILSAILITGLIVSCKEDGNTCEYEGCDSRRQTVKVAHEVRGRISVLSSEYPEVWVIVAEGIIGQSGPIFDGPDVVVACNLPDTLKEEGLTVVFSGELKSVCDDFGPPNSSSVVYYSVLSQIKKINNE